MNEPTLHEGPNVARTNITPRLATDALHEYLKLREELGALEAGENECRFEDVHRCDLCRKRATRRTAVGG